VVLQGIDNDGREGNSPAALAGLWLDQPQLAGDPLEAVPHVQPPGFEVDVFPGETESLALAQS
jgi:hypothetical protein